MAQCAIAYTLQLRNYLYQYMSESKRNLSDEVEFYLLKLVSENPLLSQRGLAMKLGISLGKTNYCLQSLIERGWIKVETIQKNLNKSSYRYILTQKGASEKARAIHRILQSKIEENKKISAAIMALKREIATGSYE